jgi:hypothetical protein
VVGELGCLLGHHRGLEDVLGKIIRGGGGGVARGPPRGDLKQFVCYLVVLARDVVELQAEEFIFEALSFLAVSLHPRIMEARVFHHLVNDELGIPSDIEASDSQLDGDAQTVD